MPAAATNRAGMSMAVAISSSSRRAVRAQPKIPEPARELGGRLVIATQHPHPRQDVVGQLDLQIVGPEPYTLAQLGEPILLQSGSQGRAGTRVDAHTGDHQRGQVPSHGRSRGLRASSWRRCRASSRSDSR